MTTKHIHEINLNAGRLIFNSHTLNCCLKTELNETFCEQYTFSLSNSEHKMDIAEIVLQPSYNCNLACKYCFSQYFQANIKEKEHVSIIKTINYFFHLFAENANRYRISFVGAGEPLLDINKLLSILDTIERFKKEIKKPIEIFLCTNGTHLSKENIKKLSLYDNLQLGISIDGDVTNHDINRVFPDGSGSYDIITTNINKIFSEASIPVRLKNIWGLSVISYNNYNILKIISHHIKLGLKSTQIKMLRTDGISYPTIDTKLLRERYEEYVDFMLNEYKNDATTYLMQILNDWDIFGKKLIVLMLKEHKFYRCGAGKRSICIDEDGCIYPCQSLMRFPDQKIGEIENGIDIQKFNDLERDHVLNNKKCVSCWSRFLCGGMCYHVHEIGQGNKSILNYYCEIEKMLSELAVYVVCSLKSINQPRYDSLVSILSMRRRVRKK